MTYIRPRINLNGTAADQLITDHMSVVKSLQDTLDAMRLIAPHPRDYQSYENPPAAYQHARLVYDKLRSDMEFAKSSLEDTLYFVMDQQHRQPRPPVPEVNPGLQKNEDEKTD